MKLDNAAWHYSTIEHQQDLRSIGIASPAGFFMAWATFAGLLSEDFQADFDAEIQALAERRLTPGAFFRCCCDGHLVDEDLDACGNAFAASYLRPQHSPCLSDFETCLAAVAQRAHGVADTWNNFDRLEPVLSQRFAQWLENR